MKIEINGVEFEKAGWNVEGNTGRMSIQTDESIAEILAEIGENQDILVYDDQDTLSSKWCNRGVQGIEKNGNGMTVSFNVSILDDNAEEQLQNGIDESVDAILELGEMISDMDEELSSQKKKVLSIDEDMTGQKEKVEALENDMEEQKQKVAATEEDLAGEKIKIGNLETDMGDQKPKVTALETKMEKAQSDITALENKYNALPNDITQRFTDLWNSYNALADRVARLENKEG